MTTKMNKYLDKSISDIECLRNQKDKIMKIVALLQGRKVFVCGNGGSSATASHMVNDLVKICHINARCLSDNVPLFSAWANDKSYDYAFVHQLEFFAKKDDVLIVMTGSGKSENIINAVKWGHDNGLYTIALIGMDGGYLKDSGWLTEYIHIPTDILHSEDIHLLINHLLAYIMEVKE